MILWNLLYDGSCCSRALLGPSESMHGGTTGTNPHQLDSIIMNLVEIQ
jgi:hypothetical protein